MKHALIATPALRFTAVGTTNNAVQGCYWTKTEQNPLVDEKGVKINRTERHVRVSYHMRVPRPGASDLGQAHTNYCFAFAGKWVDVHVLAEPSVRPDNRTFEAFETSLTYEKTPVAAATPPSE